MIGMRCIVVNPQDGPGMPCKVCGTNMHPWPQDLICDECRSGVPPKHFLVEYIRHLEGQCNLAMEALEKIADPRKRDHTEPDAYTELGCVMNIAQAALEKMGPLK